MRLTLRTLLAWMDDTLPPSEVRQIGQMVNETPFARELVEKIHRVTRQRRLTVPASSGADGTDPALVASYLDNQLNPEQVADFEKRCLTSDVHLAEVASVHQILSLIGQKAKVPPEARQRMYGLVKGREAVRKDLPQAASPAPRERVAAPVPPWVPAPAPHRSFVERFGPLAAVVVLMGVLVWAGSRLLGPEDQADDGRTVAVAVPPKTPLGPGQGKGQEPPAAPAAIAQPGPAAAPTAEAAKNQGQGEPAPAAAPGAGTEVAANEPARGEPAKEKAGPAPVTVPAGSVAVVVRTDGPLMRAQGKGEPATWDRIGERSPLREGDRLLNLDPFRSAVKLGEVTVELVRDAEVRLDAASPPRFELVRGRALVQAATDATPVEVVLGGTAVVLTPPAGGNVGLERVAARESGEAEPSAPALRITAPAGHVGVKARDGGSTTLEGPDALVFTPPGRFSPRSGDPPPPWVAEAGPSPKDQQLGKLFASFFRPSLSPAAALYTAQVDEQKEMRRLAVEGLAAIGQWPEVIAALDARDDPVARRTAIAVLREAIGLAPGMAKQLRGQLAQVLGDTAAARVEKLLIGYSPAEARQEKTYEALIADLKNPSVGVRELALDNLESLTGRDALGYNPDDPEGAGLRQWQGLLERKDLPPRAGDEKGK